MIWKKMLAGLLLCLICGLAIGYVTAWHSLRSCEDLTFRDLQRDGVSGTDALGSHVLPRRADVLATVAGPFMVETRYLAPRGLHGTLYVRQYLVTPWGRYARSATNTDLVMAPAIPEDTATGSLASVASRNAQSCRFPARLHSGSAAMDGFCFTSTLFEIERDEDARLNPGRYGRQLALWLGARFAEHGYAPEIIAEDWGYCVMLSRDPFLLWVGCGNMEETGIDASKDAIVWHCFAAAEASLLQKLFRKPQTHGALQKLQANLYAVLDDEPAIAFLERHK